VVATLARPKLVTEVAAAKAAAVPVLPTVTVLVVAALNAVVVSIKMSTICAFAGKVPMLTAAVLLKAIVVVIADSTPAMLVTELFVAIVFFP
jgi:hypothetical protein